MARISNSSQRGRQNRGRQCSNCSAVVTSSSAKFCEFCGAELPEKSDAAKAASPSAIRKSQLERLKDHPKLQEVLDSPPTVSGHEKGFGCGLGGTIIALGALIAFAVVFIGKMNSGPRVVGSSGGQIFALIPVFIIAVAAFKILTSVGSATSFENAPLRSRLSVLVDERIEVKGGGEDRRANTLYFATIEDAAGKREEFEVDRLTAGKISVGDAGVAWVKGSSLIQFRRFVL